MQPMHSEINFVVAVSGVVLIAGSGLAAVAAAIASFIAKRRNVAPRRFREIVRPVQRTLFRTFATLAVGGDALGIGGYVLMRQVGRGTVVQAELLLLAAVIVAIATAIWQAASFLSRLAASTRVENAV